MSWTTWIVAAFGAFMILGGSIGYIQKQSLISLFSGALFGTILLAMAYAIYRGAYKAHYLALLLAMALTLFFHLRYVWSAAFFPNGIMALISCLVSVALLILRPAHQEKGKIDGTKNKDKLDRM